MPELFVGIENGAVAIEAGHDTAVLFVEAVLKPEGDQIIQEAVAIGVHIGLGVVGIHGCILWVDLIPGRK